MAWSDIKGWAKRNAPAIAGTIIAPGVGTLAGLGYQKFKNQINDALLGEDPNKIAIPDPLKQVQEGRTSLANQLLTAAQGPSDAAQKAAELGGQQSAERLVANAQSLAAGARGLGAIGAMREAQKQSALGLSRLAGENAQARANAAMQDQGAQLQKVGMAADLLGQQEAGFLNQEEYRKAKAKPGFLGSLLGAAGAGIGTALGGPAGGSVGAQLGNAAGTSFQRS